MSTKKWSTSATEPNSKTAGKSLKIFPDFSRFIDLENASKESSHSNETEYFLSETSKTLSLTMPDKALWTARYETAKECSRFNLAKTSLADKAEPAPKTRKTAKQTSDLEPMKEKTMRDLYIKKV
ncbi:MAG: hypothetical protein HY394_05320 [Candidatus Diapherotrites archaeon]|nr:hypothetical protein [Candidatus Diapherotrites archaeon]